MPDHKCTEQDNIKEMKGALKDLVSEFRTEFRGVMQELKTALEDGREYRTRLQAHDETLHGIEATNKAQWEKIDGLGKRVGQLENWIAAHGDIQTQRDILDRLDKWVERQKGMRTVLLYIPTAITFAVGMLVAYDKLIT